jgi:hypothetical protein
MYQNFHLPRILLRTIRILLSRSEAIRVGFPLIDPLASDIATGLFGRLTVPIVMLRLEVRMLEKKGSGAVF